MKRRSLRAALLLGAVAVLQLGSASPASATQSCGGSNVEICQPLVTCYALGAVVFLTSSPTDAAAYFRNCIRLDRRYRLHTHESGAKHAHERQRRKRTTRSTFWSLYCEAQRRAGLVESDPICQLRAPATRGGGGGGGGGGGDTDGRSPSSQPQFTG